MGIELPVSGRRAEVLGALPVNRVVMWSYPMIRKGLIYVVDIRNGPYILRYTGPNARAVADIAYLEGNSNRGDALRLEQG